MTQTAAGADPSTRPYCQKPDACASTGPRHCGRCAAIMRGADPEYRRMMSEAKHRSFAADPSKRERVVVEASNVLKRWHARHAERVEASLAWCPADRRDEYRKLQKRLGAAEARRIISDDIGHHSRAEGREEVRRNAEAMLAKHRREVASRY